MAFLWVDSLAQNNCRFVQISGKILELLLLSMGLIFTTMVMKEAVLPYSCKLVFSSLMGFWNSINRCFLSSPLTIIITINLMVALILASSAFYGRRESDSQHQETTLTLDVDHQSPINIAPPPPPPSPSAPPLWDVVELTPPPPPPPPPFTNNTMHQHQGTSSSKQEFVKKATPLSPKPSLFNFNNALVPQPHEIDKKEASSQSTPLSPLGKWKDVFIENDEGRAYDEEDNTMEATWESIIGGGKKKQKPKKKNLKKSETWDAPPPPPRRLDSEEVLPTSPKWKELRKAETFNDAVSVTRRGGLVRRDPSMSLEEFNEKVERFIKNFNDGIRLQRQESHRRFLDIINQKRL